MSAHPEYVIHTDGGARGNPGPAAFAYVITAPGQSDIEAKGYIGETTNNIAEYTGLVRGLEHAQKLGARRVHVLSDSELMVRQMNGQYKVKNAGLLPLYEQADDLRRAFDHVRFEHIRREKNAHADRLCNEALDAVEGKAPARPKARSGAEPAPRTAGSDQRPELEGKVREDALACIQAGAAAWAQGDPNHPRAEDLWEQLWSIFVDAGILRKRS